MSLVLSRRPQHAGFPLEPRAQLELDGVTVVSRVTPALVLLAFPETAGRPLEEIAYPRRRSAP
jgi:hypothetical protein